MSVSRLRRGTIKMGVAFPEAFADPTNPSVGELNGALSFDLTPALVETGTKFELGPSGIDAFSTITSLTEFHSETFYQPQVIYEFARSTSPTAADQANAAFQLLQFADVEFFAWMRIGTDPAVPFYPYDTVSMVRVKTDWPTENISSGKNATMTQTFLPDGDILWDYKLRDPNTLFIYAIDVNTLAGYGPIADNGSGVYSVADGLGVTDNGSGVLSF